jgi:hypothetical protein
VQSPRSPTPWRRFDRRVLVRTASYRASPRPPLVRFLRGTGRRYRGPSDDVPPRRAFVRPPGKSCVRVRSGSPEAMVRRGAGRNEFAPHRSRHLFRHGRARRLPEHARGITKPPLRAASSARSFVTRRSSNSPLASRASLRSTRRRSCPMPTRPTNPPGPPTVFSRWFMPNSAASPDRTAICARRWGITSGM